MPLLGVSVTCPPVVPSDNPEATAKNVMFPVDNPGIVMAPVVDSQGHLIGVVSMTDIGRNMAEPSDVESSRSSGFYRDSADSAADVMLEAPGEGYVEERAVTVRDVMTPVIHQVPVTASVAEAARIMVDQHIHRLVVTQGKQPVGIITSMDVLKMVAEQS